MQVVVAAPLSGARARLAEALREVVLPGIAFAGVEPLAAGAGSLGAVAFFEWGPVVLDAGDWPALAHGTAQLSAVLESGGLRVLPLCSVLAIEPDGAAQGDPGPDVRVGGPWRSSALSAGHLRDALIDLARERFGQQRWSTADVLWTLDLMRLPRQAIEPITDAELTAIGFVPSRVPLLDGQRSAAPRDGIAVPPPAPPAAAPPAADPPAADPPAAPPAAPAASGMPSLAAPPPGVSLPPAAPSAVDAAPSAAQPLDPAPPPRLGLRDAPTTFIERIEDEPPLRKPFPVWAVFAVIAVLVVVGCIVAFVKLSGGSGGSAGDNGPSRPPASSTAGGSSSAAGSPTPSPTPTLAVPAGFTVKANDRQTDCAAHSFGQVQTFFQGSPCTQLVRQLVTTTADGRPVLMTVSDVTMPTPAAATAYKDVVDADGTGNVSDLMKEGVTYAGGPTAMPSSSDYESAISGTRVRVVLAAFTDGGSPTDSAALDAAAQKLVAAFS